MHTILIVDDEKDILIILEAYLNRHGFHVLTASDGQQALDILNSGQKFDLMILDKRMPGISGIDVLREIKKTGLKINVLLFSGELNLDEEQMKELAALGHPKEAILAKPVELPVFLQVVKDKLGIKE